MKVIVSVMKEFVVEVESEALAKIAADPLNDACHPLYDDWIDDAIADVEKATGLSYGNSDDMKTKGTITAVYAEDRMVLAEW